MKNLQNDKKKIINFLKNRKKKKKIKKSFQYEKSSK